MHLQAKKSLGQNFLIDGNYQRKILESVKKNNPHPSILEIGPGQGALTGHLIGIARQYRAVEKDHVLAPLLEEKLGLQKQIIIGDFLKVDLDFLGETKPWVAIGNLPYNVASQILIRLINQRQYFSDFYLMFQKEMALRLVAKPQTKDYGLLTLWSQIYTDCQILFHLPPTVFRPQPKVHSSFVHFKMKANPLIDLDEEEIFWPLMRRIFQQRRKTLGAILKAEKSRLPSGLTGKRAEELSVTDLIELFQIVK